MLDGAKALAIPARLGQHLEIAQVADEEGKLYWAAHDERGGEFLGVTFALNDFKVLEKRGEVSHFMLQDALRAGRAANPHFLDQKESVRAVSHLEFHPAWGLGSSSTLIYNIASWAKVDAMELFFKVLEGSGYDVACAGSDEAILYHLDHARPEWKQVRFNPPFAQQLYFVYLGKKQNSSEAVKNFRTAPRDPKVIEQISSITERMIRAATAGEFRELMEEHETVVATATTLQKAKDLYFKDFPGAVKSLGAWGGDFVMALAENESFDTRKYFEERRFETVISFKGMLFQKTT